MKDMRWINYVAPLIVLLGLALPANSELRHLNELLLEDQDGYEISFGGLVEAYQGQENVQVPVRLVNEEPVEYIYLSIEYDASVIVPTVVSPAMFFQYFRYDISILGRIEIELECNLVPPPQIPPIPAGDTAFAYILWDVVVDNLDRDVYAPLEFYENPNTPFPDNFIMRDNGYFIVPPQLMLTPGTVYVFRPIYGDTNLNSAPYEVGDMITFISYLSGQIEFSPRQMANSDCNRDRIPATIADLVYMLNVINGEPDTLLVDGSYPIAPEAVADILDIYSPKPLNILDNNCIINLYIDTEQLLGGFLIKFEAPEFVSRIGEVALANHGSGMIILNSNVAESGLAIVGCSLGGALNISEPVHLQIPITADLDIEKSDIRVIESDYSSVGGEKIQAEFRLEIEKINKSGSENGIDDDAGMGLAVYPNPFNSRALISFSLARTDFVSVEIFDILGRNVTTLINGTEAAGWKTVVWDGKNSNGDSVTSGIYFCRLWYGGEEQIEKLHYLK